MNPGKVHTSLSVVSALWTSQAVTLTVAFAHTQSLIEKTDLTFW